jgi:hypothetical protein
MHHQLYPFLSLLNRSKKSLITEIDIVIEVIVDYLNAYILDLDEDELHEITDLQNRNI